MSPEEKLAANFDQTDMKDAKEKLGGKACIGGNVPSSLFATGAVTDKTSPEVVHAFLKSVKKYGIYS